MRTRLRLPGSAVALAVTLLASPAAAVDMTGRWLVTDQNSLAGTHQYLLDAVQADTSLTISYALGSAGHSGSIDPATGAFTFHVPSSPPPFPVPGCSGTTYVGTVAPDSQSFAGSYSGEYFRNTPPGPGCSSFDGTFSGVPSDCGDGVVDPGEECDSGNDSGTSCCGYLCEASPGGYPCPGGVCDGAGTCGPSTTTTSSSTTTTTVPVCSDSQAMAAIRAEADSDCAQAGRGCVDAPTHGTYVACVREEATTAVAENRLPADCLQPLVRCAARSTCGRTGYVTCCRTRVDGRTSCATKSAADRCRAPRGGTACVGSFASCCDACGPGGCH